MFGLIFLSCSTQSDAIRYPQILENGIAKHCLDLQDRDLQGDCLSSFVKKDPFNEKIPELCSKLSSEKWRSECFFQLSDEGEHIGETAIALCSQSGEFKEDCLRHAGARHVEEQVHIVNDSNPQRVLPKIYGILKEYLEDPIAQPMARDILVRKIAAQNPRKIFSSSFCEGIPEDMCAQVYIVRSLGSAQQRKDGDTWPEHCGSEMEPNRAVEWGWKAYDPSMQKSVDIAWKQACQAQ